MTVDELYNHITSQMSAEKALKTFLKGSLITYNKLKFESPTEVLHPLFIITLAAMDMDWEICVEKDTENVEGLVVGTKKYVKRTLNEERK